VINPLNFQKSKDIAFLIMKFKDKALWEIGGTGSRESTKIKNSKTG